MIKAKLPVVSLVASGGVAVLASLVARISARQAVRAGAAAAKT